MILKLTAVDALKKKFKDFFQSIKNEKCYEEQAYNGKAVFGMCDGFGTERCAHCKHHWVG